MASSIDPTFPAQGRATTASVRQNFAHAKSEIEALQTKTTGIVNVTEYGAVGDGTTDDTAAFVAANAVGSLIYIPKPSVGYTFASTVALTSPVLVDPNASWDQLTDGGKLTFGRGFLIDGAGGSNIWRFADRVFVGEAAVNFSGSSLPDSGNSWLDASKDGPAYIAANAQLLVMTEQRRYGIAGIGKTSLPAGGAGAIGIAAGIINDGTAPNDTNGWGIIIEGQHECTTKTTYALEIALKNASGQDVAITPYNVLDGATFGIMLAGGGDDAFGPSATHPCTAGIVFTTNNTMGWNTGIQFRSGSIVGTEAEAIAFANGHALRWYEGNGTVSAVLKSTNNTADRKLTLEFQSTGLTLKNNADKSVLFVSVGADHVNRIQLVSGATSQAPQIQSAGDDTNIDLRLIPKGTGLVGFGAHSALAAETLSGYITVKDAGGNTRKLAVVS